ncbi:hypothetical protein EDD22DRAFT_852970 [Suillus occidentalis]|nr:hypothetical protein EDD22DRAFT_852970 [Suillus occidentalis]
MPLSSLSDALITRLSSQPHTNEEIEIAQRPSRPRVVEVAAVRDRQTLVVARGPNFMKALRAHLRQSQSHAQAQASSSHTQPVGASTSATHPAPGTAAAQPPPIPWWGHIVLFLCCTSPHAEGLLRLFFFPFPSGFLYNDPSHVGQIRERLTTIIPNLMIKVLLIAISSSERVFRCILRADTGFYQRLLLRMVVTIHWSLGQSAPLSKNPQLVQTHSSS